MSAPHRPTLLILALTAALATLSACGGGAVATDAGDDLRLGSLSAGCTPGLRGRSDDRRFRLAAPPATTSAAVSHCALPLPAIPEAALPVQGPEVIG